MASPSDPTNPEAAAAIRRKKNGPPIKFLVPLVYAPVLPLIRLTLRKNPVVRDRLFTAVLVYVNGYMRTMEDFCERVHGNNHSKSSH